MNERNKARIENVLAALDEILDELESIRDDEQAAFKALPAAWRNSDNAKAMESALENLEDALGSMDEVVCYLEDALGDEEE